MQSTAAHSCIIPPHNPPAPTLNCHDVATKEFPCKSLLDINILCTRKLHLSAFQSSAFFPSQQAKSSNSDAPVSRQVDHARGSRRSSDRQSPSAEVGSCSSQWGWLNTTVLPLLPTKYLQPDRLVTNEKAASRSMSAIHVSILTEPKSTSAQVSGLKEAVRRLICDKP